MLSVRARVLLVVAALLLIPMYLTPIWRVYLDAPQYPEGIGMQIWINTVKGMKENDLENINNLNHYIGMKRIEPESIPELRIMPIVVGVLIAAGLGAAALGRRRIAQAWVITFLVIAVVGLADFWKWEYEYGHDLDMENAIIKIPGMSYQPPLIGSKQLLNFTATSLPGAGGIAAMLALGIGVLALVVDRRGPGTPSSTGAAAADLTRVQVA
jgi:copper chaperone NosL